MEYVQEMRRGKLYASFHIDQVVWFSSHDKYVFAIAADGRSLMTEIKLKQVLDACGDKFVRSHRSHVVRKDAVIDVIPSETGDSGVVMLKGGFAVKLARKRMQAVMASMRAK